MKYTEDNLREELKTKEYEYGFYTELDSETFAKGLNGDIDSAISRKKNEPQCMTDWRNKAFRDWENMDELACAKVKNPNPNCNEIPYYSAPRPTPKLY